VAPTFRLLDLICVQESEDVGRWAALGVERGRIRRTGSIKYDPKNVDVDLTLPADVLRELKIDNRPIVFGGSTHAGEEEILAKTFVDLRQRFPNLFLMIAPRHAERAREVHRALEQIGLRVALRSQLRKAGAAPDCLLLDSTGELQNWYAAATVVFTGKSLAAHGGQNPAEAIAAGKPIIFGPHMENFAALARALVMQGGAVQVSSPDELRNSIADLLRDSKLREGLVENARTVLEAHAGATARSAQLVIDLRSQGEQE
jgi:3-deoxy-D-manno-octulosonic-acid transferase